MITCPCCNSDLITKTENKHIYKCEECGKTFSDDEDLLQCEHCGNQINIFNCIVVNDMYFCCDDCADTYF